MSWVNEPEDFGEEDEDGSGVVDVSEAEDASRKSSLDSIRLM